MQRDYFIDLENRDHQRFSLNDLVDQLAFNEQGLVPVITQDAERKSVLMFAWMNREALALTVSTKRMVYWSRSRQQLWVKGETSGHTQRLVSMSFDCDGDALLCLVEQTGAACHTGRLDCFYLNVDLDAHQIEIGGRTSIE